MKKIYLIFLIILVVSASLNAQRFKRPRPTNIFNNISGAPGYITINEFHTAMGLNKITEPYSRYIFGFTTIQGYQVNNSFVVGAGTGLSFYNGGMLVPLFVDLRYRIYVSKWTTYVWGDGGFLIDFKDINLGTKMFLNPGFGVRYTISRKLGADIGTGLLVQMGGGGKRDSFVNLKAGLVYVPARGR